MAGRRPGGLTRRDAVWGALALSAVFVALPLASLWATGSYQLLDLLGGWAQLVAAIWLAAGVVLLVERVRRWVRHE